MNNKNRKAYLLVVLLTVSALIFAACSRQPQKMPEPGDQGAPQQNTQGTEPDISVYMHESGEKKSMKMEDYIAGVVAGEMKSDWPVTALAAQAIIARTFTVQAIEEKGGVPERGTQASTDIKEFQAYSAAAVNDNVRKAVEMTRGMIITYQGKPAQTWFHASAGGMTATAKEGLDYQQAEPPYIQSVQSPDELAPADVKNWTAAFPKQQVMAVLAGKGQTVNRIDSIEIGQKGPSGRAMTLVINKNINISGPQMRLGLGSTELKSMLLDKIEVTGDRVTFSGRGYGHGVGLSQWGANKLATTGKTPEEIIAHYFKGVTVEKRWN